MITCGRIFIIVGPNVVLLEYLKIIYPFSMPNDILRYMNEKYSLEYYQKRDELAKKRKRAYYLKNRYHTTADEFATLLIKQEGVCAICKGGEPSSKWYSDYHRTSGHTRGILCSKCSHGISSFHDDIEIIRSAVVYLESFDNLKE